MTMDSYIVRVYRFDRSKPRAIIGVVEEAGSDDKKAFMNIDELWKILNPHCDKPRKKIREQKMANLQR